ncbi:prokineticin receptor 2-like [Anneissia japonica]|uniref:prokineticin receptor 2-like n=1 Tax=Anneissia japonica TaxID=1529436 RepID=UPI0014256E0A|nr:prokineticin receptor 2-like [Anneissia japonica]
MSRFGDFQYSSQSDFSGIPFEHTFEINTLPPFIRSHITTPNVPINNSTSERVLDMEHSYFFNPSEPTDYYSDYDLLSDCYTIFVPKHTLVSILLAISYFLIVIICGFGNGLLIFIILSQRRLRTITNLLIVNLALSDMVVAVLSAPLSGYYYLIDNWVFGDVLCPIVNTVKNVSLYVSVTTLLVIAIDRYQGIFHPLEPRMTKPILTAIILVIWVFAILICLPTPLFTHTISSTDCSRDNKVITYCAEFWTDKNIALIYITCITVLMYILPMTIMSFVYVRIGIQLWYHRAPPGHVTTERQQEITNVRKQKTIPMLITVVLAFGICWGPYYVYNLMQHITHHYGIEGEFFSGELTAFYVVESIAMMNSVISTFIFFILNPAFRKELLVICKRMRRYRVGCPRLLRLSTRELSFHTFTPKTNSTNIPPIDRNGYMPMRKAAESSESKV